MAIIEFIGRERIGCGVHPDERSAGIRWFDTREEYEAARKAAVKRAETSDTSRQDSGQKPRPR